MNGTADNHEESAWDSLAADLGLDAVTPAKPVPAKVPAKPAAAHRKPVPEPEPEPEPEFDDAFGVFDETAAVAPAVMVDDESDEAGVEDGPGLLDDEAPGEATGEEPGTGKRRRRRRRRKKTGTEQPAAALADHDESGSDDAPAADFDEPEVSVGEAAAEMDEEEDDDEPTTAPTLDEEMEDESSEPLPEWKVVAWTDLVATLHR